MKNVTKGLIAGILGLSLTGCGGTQSPQSSQPFVSDVEHTTVKRQSIGNCWLYAAGTWAESLHLAATDETANVSESYWTWWHWYDQIRSGRASREISTGGHWSTSSNIILKHGVVAEGDFIAEEADVDMSARQSRAESYINTALSTGELANSQNRTPAKIRKVLDEAFGTDMAAAEAIATPASEYIVGKEDTNAARTLAEALAGNRNQRWTYYSYQRTYGKSQTVRPYIKRARKALLKRVMTAVNDYNPVVISTMIDFNAMDNTDATFRLSTLEEAGGMGRQGGHMLVLEDYTVSNVPGIGDLGEGDLSDEEKELALQGDLETIVTKNSWGKNRPERGLTDGYTRFEMGYLDAQLEWESGSSSYYMTTLSGFVLPPNY